MVIFPFGKFDGTSADVLMFGTLASGVFLTVSNVERAALSAVNLFRDSSDKCCDVMMT